MSFYKFHILFFRFYTLNMFSFMEQSRVDIIKNVLYSVSLYFLRFRKCFSILIFQKIPISFMDDVFFLSLLHKDYYIARKHIGGFCLFLLRKDFDIFHVLFFEAFLCFSDNNNLSLLYIEKKKSVLPGFLYALKIDFTI